MKKIVVTVREKSDEVKRKPFKMELEGFILAYAMCGVQIQLISSTTGEVLYEGSGEALFNLANEVENFFAKALMDAKILTINAPTYCDEKFVIIIKN